MYSQSSFNPNHSKHFKAFYHATEAHFNIFQSSPSFSSIPDPSTRAVQGCSKLAGSSPKPTHRAHYPGITPTSTLYTHRAASIQTISKHFKVLYHATKDHFNRKKSPPQTEKYIFNSSACPFLGAAGHDQCTKKNKALSYEPVSLHAAAV